jgi:hypothetical protein
MLPALSHRAWRELIVGRNPVASSHFGFNLLLTNNRIYYRGDPSEVNVDVLVQQVYDYLCKYEGLYQVELKQIFGEDYTALY